MTTPKYLCETCYAHEGYDFGHGLGSMLSRQTYCNPVTEYSDNRLRAMQLGPGATYLHQGHFGGHVCDACRHRHLRG